MRLNISLLNTSLLKRALRNLVLRKRTPLKRMLNRLRHWREAIDRLLGLPNYERYLAHMQATHPDQPPLSREAFYDEAQRCRYESGSDRPRCC